jgi:membrane-associated phospholipid phosphatase
LGPNIKHADRNLIAATTTMGFSVVLFLLAFLSLDANAIIQLEHQILSALAEISHPRLDLLLNWSTLLGDFNILCPIVAFSTLVLLYKHHFGIASALCVSFFGAALSTTLLKAVFDRPRPDLFESALVHLPMNAAFPSGHTTHATALALFVAWLAFRDQRYLFLLAAAVIAMLVAFSRLYLQVHWPTDLLGGLAVSLFWVSFGVIIHDRLHKKQDR